MAFFLPTCTQVKQLTDTFLPVVQGFQSDVLGNPNTVALIDALSDGPLQDGIFQLLGGLSSGLGPMLQTITVSDCTPGVRISAVPHGVRMHLAAQLGRFLGPGSCPRQHQFVMINNQLLNSNCCLIV
jgi:hypothetical protein